MIILLDIEKLMTGADMALVDGTVAGVEVGTKLLAQLKARRPTHRSPLAPDAADRAAGLAEGANRP